MCFFFASLLTACLTVGRRIHRCSRASETGREKSVLIQRPFRVKLILWLLFQGEASNLTTIRRRKEFLQILESMGGIAHLSSADLQEKHVALLQSLKSGGSAPPGTVIDKRTIKKTFERLVELEEVAQTTVSFTSVHGAPRQVAIYSIPHVSAAAIREYVDTLKGNVPAHRPPRLRKLSDTVKFDKSVDNQMQTQTPVVIFDNTVRFVDLKEPEEQRARIMMEPRVVSQSTGFMVGRFARARELHLFLLDQMERESLPSPLLLSPRVFSTSYLWIDMPFGAFCAQIPPSEVYEPLRNFLDLEENRWLPVQSVPEKIRKPLSISSSRVRTKFQSALTILQSLGLVVPLKVVSDDSPHMFSVGDLRFQRADDTSLPSHYFFPDDVPFHKFYRIGKSPAPFVGDFDVSSQAQRLLYWEALQRTSMTDAADVIPSDDAPPYTGNVDAIRPITLSRSWESDYVLSPLQREYLTNHIDPITGAHNLGDPEVMRAHEAITGAPADVIRRFVVQQSQNLRYAAERIKSREARAAKHAEKQTNAQQNLARKAAEVRQRLEVDWSNVLRDAHPKELTDDQIMALAPLRDQFFKSGGRLALRFSQEKLTTKILAALGGRSRIAPLPTDLTQKYKKPLPIFTPVPSTLVTAEPSPSTSRGTVYRLINAQEPRPKKGENKGRYRNRSETANSNEFVLRFRRCNRQTQTIPVDRRIR